MQGWRDFRYSRNGIAAKTLDAWCPFLLVKQTSGDPPLWNGEGPCLETTLYVDER